MSAEIMKYLCLPKETTAVELRHVQRINRIALWACAAHLPLFALVAWLCGTSMIQALGFGTLLLLGPTIATFTLKNPRTLSLVFGFTSMALGALLVHLGQGPMQIEMHFHFFAALALLAVWGNPLIIWVATVTVAVHHGLFWLILPHSVFNYEASFWVVLVHAAFVVVEAIAASFIARNFFDNVIGLEKIVQAKTQEVRRRNEDMKTILDNTSQGFMTVTMDGAIEPERSAVVSSWLGDLGETTVFKLFGRINAVFGDMMQLGWEAVKEDIMPLEVTLDQLPKRLQHGPRSLGFEYRPIMAQGRVSKMLVVISDITAQLEADRLERAQRETMTVFQRINRDRNGFLEFLDEGTRLVSTIVSGAVTNHGEVWRAVHTLKGTNGMFGLTSIADLCHGIEDQMAETKGGVSPENRAALKRAWEEITARLKPFLGEEGRVHVQEADLLDALARIEKGIPREELAALINSWRYEPMRLRFARFAEQATTVAERLGKGPVEVRIEDHGLRLPQETWAPFWSAFSHAIRNAVDHGIESPEARATSGKTARLKLSVEVVRDKLVVAIADNGRGIDWDLVRERCKARGLPCGSAVELTEALFSDGFSTKSEATTYSGRGVGMGSLRQECQYLGGGIELTSSVGRGTTVKFTFPLTAILGRPVLKVAA